MSKHLWAPWRIEYIRAPKDQGCFFCEYWADPGSDEANLVLARGEGCFAVMNKYPYNGGHMMVAPSAHVARLAELEEGVLVGMMRMVQVAEKVLGDVLRPQGFNVGFNLGRPAGAGVEDHLHLHVVPRWEGDTNFMPVLDDTRVVPVALAELWALLAPAFGEEVGKC